MEKQGWISLHRKLLDNPIFKDSEAVHLWIYLLLKASHQETTLIINDELITLKRGQLAFGIRSCSKDTGISIKRIRTRLALMKKLDFLAHQKAHRNSIITIYNYDKYQSIEKKEGTPKGKQRAHRGHTYNNDNNENNIYTQQAEDIYNLCPRKADKNNSIRSIVKLLQSGETKESLLQTVENYKASIEKKETERNFIIQSNNFFGRAARYKEYQNVPHQPANEIAKAIERCKERGDF